MIKNKKLIAIGLVAVGLALTFVGYGIYHKGQKEEVKKPVNDNKVEEKVDPNKPTVKAVDGYTSYVVKYVDKDGKKIDIKNIINYMRDGDDVYSDINTARKNKVIGDLVDNEDMFYIQIKKDATVGWVVEPKNKESIKEWDDSKKNIQITFNPNEGTNKKIVEYIVTLDYTKDKVQPMYEEIIK